MIYITMKQSPVYQQMTLEEFLFQPDYTPQVINNNITNTRTYKVDNVNEKLLNSINVGKLIDKLIYFNSITKVLKSKKREELYRSYFIPKRSGGLRRIDEPSPELMDALRSLKTIIELDFGALYHTSAFAYITNRCTLSAIKRHQENESKWFGKFDLSNFFGNTTLDFVLKMFSMVFPFSEVMKDERGYKELYEAMELAFLNGGLPQGSPVSPLITNVMMIPIDHTLANNFRDLNNQRFVYTRYADDFIISSKYTFRFKDIEANIIEVLKEFEAPFTINKQKTRYGSSAGSNWNLGVMLNKDNKITVGHKNKKRFQAMLTSYVLDKKNGKHWDKSDIQALDGYRNYYTSVEGDVIVKLINHLGNKFDVNIIKMIKEDLRT